MFQMDIIQTYINSRRKLRKGVILNGNQLENWNFTGKPLSIKSIAIKCYARITAEKAKL